MGDLLKTAGRWLSGERVRIESKRAVLGAVAVSVLLVAWGFRDLRTIARPLTHAKPLPPLPADEGDKRWGLPLATRQAIFMEFAAAEPHARAEGTKAFAGPALEWSADDHRGGFERNTAREIGAKFHVTPTQAYLCLDEGIRAHWPGPDGKPLDPHVVPLNPRRKYGF